jgi:hypothetical protein
MPGLQVYGPTDPYNQYDMFSDPFWNGDMGASGPNWPGVGVNVNLGGGGGGGGGANASGWKDPYASIPYLNILGGAAGAAAGLMGTIDARQAQNWNQAFTINQLNNANWMRDFALGQWQQNVGPYGDAVRGMQQAGQGYLFDEQNGLYPQLRGYGNDLMNTAQNSYWANDRGLWMPGETQNYLDQMQGMLGPGSYNDAIAQAGQEMYGKFQGGVNAMNDWGMGTAQQIGQGTAPGQQYLMDYSTQLANNQGNTGDTWAASKGYQDMMGAGGYTGRMNDIYGASNVMAQNYGFSPDMADALNRQIAVQKAGGYNPNLNSIIGAGQGLMGNEGMAAPMGQAIGNLSQLIGQGGATSGTQTMNQIGAQGLGGGGMTGGIGYGQDYLQSLLNSQGATAGSDALQGLGLRYAQNNPLLGVNAAANMARENAADSSRGAYEQGMRQAYARGNGPGVTTGQSNQIMRGVTDEALRREAAAMRQAVTGEEGLGLQQQGQGFSALNSGLSQAAGREQMGAQMLPQLEGLKTSNMNLYGNLMNNAGTLEAQRYGMGFSGLGNLYGVANQRFGTGANTAMSAEQQALAQLNAANNMTQGLYGVGNQRYFGAMDDAQAMEAMRLQNMTGLGNLAMQGNQISAGRMGQAGNMMQNYLGNQMGGVGAASQWGGVGANAMNAGLNQVGASNQFGSDALNRMYGMYSGQMGQNLNRINGQTGAMYQGLQSNLGLGNQLQGWGLAGLTGMQNLTQQPYQMISDSIRAGSGLNAPNYNNSWAPLQQTGQWLSGLGRNQGGG